MRTPPPTPLSSLNHRCHSERKGPRTYQGPQRAPALWGRFGGGEPKNLQLSFHLACKNHRIRNVPTSASEESLHGNSGSRTLVPLRVSRHCRLIRQKLRKRPLRTHMMQLDSLQVVFSLDRRCHRHHAIQAARIVGSVVVLRSAIHINVHPLTGSRVLR
jgi:hypothetical protein